MKCPDRSTYECDDKGSGYTIKKKGGGVGDLTIAPIETSKDDIAQPDFAKHENMYIPPLGSSVVISGKSGSGKSTLLANLLMDERFYGPSLDRPKGWFEKIFLFSPTANGDDIQKSLNIPKKYVFTDLEEAPELLALILDSQQKRLDEAGGADLVPQFCIIFDDVIGDTKFMNDKAFTRCFYQVRHVNCTTFICTQHFKKVPKICRLQANFVFFFQGSAAEVDTVVEEFAPPMYSKNEVREMIHDATCKKYSFLTINMKLGWDKRFRRNLDDFIFLARLSKKEDGEENDNGDGDDEDNKKEGRGKKEDKKKDGNNYDAYGDIQGRVLRSIVPHTNKYATDEQEDRIIQPSEGAGSRFDWSRKRF